jgi:hypothetical protein
MGLISWVLTNLICVADRQTETGVVENRCYGEHGLTDCETQLNIRERKKERKHKGKTN